MISVRNMFPHAMFIAILIYISSIVIFESTPANATTYASSTKEKSEKWPEAMREEIPQVELTPEERVWLEAHPEIVLGIPTSYPPLVIKKADGKHVGMLVDLFDQINRRLNSTFSLHTKDSWPDIQEKARNRKIDGLALGGKDPSREALYNATNIVLTTYFSVFARSQNEYRLKRFADLAGMRIGYKRGARPTRSLLEKLPSAILKPYDDNESLTQAMLSKEIDVIVAWMSFDHWRKEKLQGTIDNILLITEYPIEMVSYIRDDWPELVPIFNKVLASLQKDELPRIINKWYGNWPQPSTAFRLLLTSEEQVWLDKKHTVRVRIVDWPPYQIVNNDKPPQGIVIEYLKLIVERTGILFKMEATDRPFVEYLKSMKQRRGPDMTGVIVPTTEREQYFHFTQPYLSSPYVIFTREDDNLIFDIQGLIGKSIAVPHGHYVQEQLSRDFPQIRQVLFDSDVKALRSVATGKADAYIGNLTAASHIIHRQGLSDLKVAAPSPFKEQILSMGVRRDWPELSSIINKALASITEEEKTAIRNKYLAIKFEQGINKAKLLKWGLIAGGSTMGIILIFLFWNRQMSREINRRKQTEQALKNARDAAETANQAKSLFLANMSHELRTPLNAILGFSGMLAKDQDTSTDQMEKLAIINRSGQHLLSMINDILDISKIEAGRVELQAQPIDLVALIKDISIMLRSAATAKGLSIVQDVEKVSIPFVETDAGKLRQILVNLLANAVKFTDEGGVTIRCATDRIPEEPNRCHVVIEVADTGPGIEPARQAEIFEPFVKERDEAERKGTGLGLSICKEYVDFMGGTLEVASDVGRGALFRVRLPAQIAKAADVGIPVGQKPRVISLVPTQKTRRILVADDNPENLLLLKSLLEEVGLSVIAAKNGKEAVAAFEKESLDFIWMDMRMPVMDGYEATRRIRSLPGGNATKIVAITASAFQDQRPKILAAGCNDVINKPFQVHEIFETMGRLLDIEYIYEQDDEAALAREIELTSDLLEGLPAELLQELNKACLSLDTEAISTVIKRIEQQSPNTAKGLQSLLDDFQIGRIRELLGET